MIESWRWFGPYDQITLPEVAQTGARGVVTALHDIPYGVVWPREAIAARKALIADADVGLHWNVVESLPVHEDIKLGQGDLGALYANWRQSMANLAVEGITTICYNFMPLLDWTRTDLAMPLRGGAEALRLDMVRLAAFEVFILERPHAAEGYSNAVIAAAKDWADAATEGDRDALLANIMAGLPGAFRRYTVPELREILARYDGFDHADLRANYARFLAEVVPTAAELGMRLCVHPDDPPFDMFGLPRVVSRAEDIAWIMAEADDPANGLTLCSGSLGAGLHNDVPAIAERFAACIHFAHLRNVSHDDDGSFYESDHLGGRVDMVALVKVLLDEQDRRRAEGRADALIPFRPDHGHRIGSDIGGSTHPGYPLNGRMRGLAELRGVIAALDAVAGRRPGEVAA